MRGGEGGREGEREGGRGRGRDRGKEEATMNGFLVSLHFEHIRQKSVSFITNCHLITPVNDITHHDTVNSICQDYP